MTASSTLPAPNLMPLMRYRDLADAMSWLEQAFGFEKQIAVSDNDGAVIYGQMTYRGGLMMLGAVRDTELDKLMRQPDEVGGAETQSCYLVVEDADEHYARACDAGAEIVLDIKSDGLGRRGYSCRDPEGHIWNFGTYSPGRGITMTVAGDPASAATPQVESRKPRVLMTLAALLLGLGAAGWWYRDAIATDFAKRLAEVAGQQTAADISQAYAELVKVRGEKRETDSRVLALGRDLEAARSQRVTLQSDAEKASQALAEAQRARLTAETAAASLRQELKRGQEAMNAAVEANRITEEKLAVKVAAPAAVAQNTPADVPAPQSRAAPDAAGAPAASLASGSEIETSATQIASKADTPAPATKAQGDAPAASALDTGPKAAAKSGDMAEIQDQDGGARTRQKPKKVDRSRSRRALPTYVVEQHEVPWPYSTWYR